MTLTVPIEEWFKEKGQKNYADSYANLVNYLEPKHKSVVASANYQELVQTGKTIYLNDHGPKHIQAVINRATQFINTDACQLNTKEVFYLMNAIQFHDIGNLYGRSGHVTAFRDMLPEVKPILQVDDIELRYIRQIAEAHGGELPNGDKDKISKLLPQVLSHDVEVRQRFLAAVLRFSDELADEKARCDESALLENRLPKASEVYHAYSYCLDSTRIKHSHQSIELHFKIPKDFALKKFGSANGDVHLIDEIYGRILKMHQEKIYTSRFWRRYIDIDKIWVYIEFYSSYLDDHVFSPITFEVRETGYPNNPNDGLYELCCELTIDGQKLDGSYIATKIKTDS